MTEPITPGTTAAAGTTAGASAAGEPTTSSATSYTATGRDPSDVSVGQLMSDISADMSTLMRQEVELAKVELKQEAAKAGKAAGMLGAAGFAGYMTVLFLSIALWGALSAPVGAGWAALIVAAIWAVIGAVLFVIGRKRMQEVNPKPERTVETAQEIPGALKPGSSTNP